MKKILFTLMALISVVSFSQKKEKIKGNKEVLIKKFTIPNFSTLEVGEKFEVAIQKSTDTTRVVIETDDNLFDVIHFSVENDVLIFSTSKDIVKKKRLRITVFVSEKLHTISVKEKGKVYNEEDISFENLKINAVEKSEIDLNLQIKNSLNIEATDKAELVVNGVAKTTKIHIAESAEVKGDFSASDMDIVVDDHGYTKIEGAAKQLKLTANKKADIRFRNFKVTDAAIKAFDKSNLEVNVSGNLLLMVSGSTSTELYGNPKINLKRFKDNATLYKK